MPASSAHIRDTSAQDRMLQPGAGSSRRRRALTTGAGLGLLAGVGLWLATDWLAAARSFDVDRLRIATVARGDLIRDLSADGRVIAANSPILYAIAAGTVTLHVVAGDRVDAGQALAVIDSPELHSRLAQERATLASMQAEAERARLDAQLVDAEAEKTLQQARIAHTAAMRDVQRYQRAYDGGALSQIELAQAQDRLKQSELELANAHRDARLRTAGAGLESRHRRQLVRRQQAVVAEQRRQVEALTLRAPFDGQVGQIHVPQGTGVMANGAVLSVVDLSRFEVEIKVPESFARELEIGMPAEVGNGDRRGRAEVSAIAPEVVNGQVNARLRFAAGAQPPSLRQSQRLSTRIVLGTRHNVLKVERGPFLERDGGHTAYVVDGQTAVRRPIRVGVSSLSEVEILAGVQPGDRLVVSGSELFEGVPQARLSGRQEDNAD